MLKKLSRGLILLFCCGCFLWGVMSVVGGGSPPNVYSAHVYMGPNAPTPSPICDNHAVCYSYSFANTITHSVSNSLSYTVTDPISYTIAYSVSNSFSYTIAHSISNGYDSSYADTYTGNGRQCEWWRRDKPLCVCLRRFGVDTDCDGDCCVCGLFAARVGADI